MTEQVVLIVKSHGGRFKDKNDNWVVGLQVLEDLDFVAIHSDLEQLEQIEYVPFDDIIEQ